MKNSLRRGLFHPDDIKTIGLATVNQGPMSAPLPSLSKKSPRPSISPRGTLGHSSGSSAATPVSATSSTAGHTRSASFASGSMGRAELQKQQAEFGKYAEDDEEDYDDVFGKPNASCECDGFIDSLFNLHRLLVLMIKCWCNLD